MKALVLGGRGLLAHALVPALESRGFTVCAVGREDCDIRDPAMLERLFAAEEPSLVVNCAAYTAVDQAEREPDLAFAINARGAENVARVAAVHQARLLHISTDYAFDGKQARPYLETDPPSPIGVYARSKVLGEELVRSCSPNAYIVRTGELFGDGGRHFFAAILERARKGLPLRVVDDQVVTPTWTRALASQLCALVTRGPPGLYHATADGDTTWYAAAQKILNFAKLPAEVTPIKTHEYAQPAPRPPYSVLSHQKLESLGLYQMSRWDVSLREWWGGVEPFISEKLPSR